jgi:hypothetical protein
MKHHCFIAVSRTQPCATCGRPFEDEMVHYAGVSQGWPPGPTPEQIACSTCQDPAQRGGPSHTPSQNCKSGKRPHCSCDTCY